MLKLQSVQKVYQMGRTVVPALRGLDLEIPDGAFVAIIGPSGSGKSTLMHLIGCLDTPSSGSIALGDTALGQLLSDQRAELRGRRIGFVFQTFNLIHNLTALENVELPMLFQKVPRAQRRERARLLLEQVGLGDRLHHTPAELSGGEQQRVAIARALANDPEIILADEPTGNLDSETGRRILELLKQLHQAGKTVIVVTHNPQITEFADMTVHLRDGQLLNLQPPAPTGMVRR